MQKQVEGSMFGAVLFKLDCLVTGSSGVGGEGGQHSTRDSLTGDFLSFNSEKNEGFFLCYHPGGGAAGAVRQRVATAFCSDAKSKEAVWRNTAHHSRPTDGPFLPTA